MKLQLYGGSINEDDRDQKSENPPKNVEQANIVMLKSYPPLVLLECLVLMECSKWPRSPQKIG